MAMAAGRFWIAVSRPFKRELLRTADLIDNYWIVDDTESLLVAISRVIADYADGRRG